MPAVRPTAAGKRNWDKNQTGGGKENRRILIVCGSECVAEIIEGANLTKSLQPTSFKFRFVVAGNPKGFLRSPEGIVGPDHLQLDNTTIPFSAISDTVSRGDRLVLEILLPALEGKAGKYLSDSVLVVQPKGVPIDRLKALIDQNVAAIRLEEKRRLAREQGTEHLIRVESCPTCCSEIDLTGFEPSRYVYCPYCEVIHETGQTASLDREYRICEQCGYFGRVQSYTEFYFYFLLIAYGFSYKQRFLCTSCANSLFWQVLLANLIFVIGVPTALWVKIKSKLGRDPKMAELSRANDLAWKGKLQEAAQIFDSIRLQFPEHPGVLMNEGMANLKHGSTNSGNKLLGRALVSCPNYHPLHSLLDDCV